MGLDPSSHSPLKHPSWLSVPDPDIHYDALSFVFFFFNQNDNGHPMRHCHLANIVKSIRGMFCVGQGMASTQMMKEKRQSILSWLPSPEWN